MAMHYRESGKYSPAIIAFIPLMFAAVGLLSVIYGYALFYNPFIYLSFLLWLGYIFVVSVVASLFVKWGKSRNTTVSVGFGVLTGLSAVYLSWAGFLMAYSGGDNLVAQPGVLVGAVMSLSETGWYELFGFVPSGIVLMGIWGIEAIGIVAGPALLTHTEADTSVFCERCNVWAIENEGVLVFTHPDQGALDSSFVHQDLKFLSEAQPLTGLEPSFFQIDAEWCQTCNELHTLSLRKVGKKINDEGEEEMDTETLHEDLVVRKETHEAILAAQGQFGVLAPS